MKELLEKIYTHAALSKSEAKLLFDHILEAATPPARIAAVLSAYRMRQPSLDELEGFMESALSKCIKLDFSGYDAVDVCGTGGDHKGTFNISTLTAILLAACGRKVIKHGGGAVSSTCGSSNLLEALGYKFTTDQGVLKKQLDGAGICFLHAPLFHPSFKNVVPIRKELGVKTVFNVLGPLVNPASPKYQLIGVYNLELVRLISFLGQRLKKRLCLVHTLDGCDEVSLTAGTKVVSDRMDRVYNPSDFGLDYISYSEINEGASIESAVAIFVKVLKGEGSAAQISVAAANAGLALFYIRSFEEGGSLIDCVQEAKSVLESGEGYRTFKKALELAA